MIFSDVRTCQHVYRAKAAAGKTDFLMAVLCVVDRTQTNFSGAVGAWTYSKKPIFMRAMPRISVKRWTRYVLLAFAGLMMFVQAADAAELVMVRREGCVWCARWDRDIGSIYDKTELSRRAPLRMVDIARVSSELRTRTPVIYTPTFVVAENGQEIGRIEGYPGDAFFWGLLEQLLEQASGQSARSLTGPHFGRTP
jgi:hypothetical protein